VITLKKALPVNYKLRDATEEDRPWLDQLRRGVYFDLMVDTFGHFEEERHQRHCEECWNQGNIQIVCVERESIGMLQVAEGASTIELCEIQILPDHQGNGIGSALLRDVIDRSRSTGKNLVLSVALKNMKARSLYERLGFGVTGRSDTHIHMQYMPQSRGSG